MPNYIVTRKDFLLPDLPDVISDMIQVREILQNYRITLNDFFTSLQVTSIFGYSYIDLEEITEPDSPETNMLRLYTEAIQGFSFLKYLDDGGMKREFMRDSMLLAKNVSGNPIAASRIVYATGNEDNIPTIGLAKANSLSTMPAIGVTVESIANGAFGRVIQVGVLENVNTSSLSVSDVIYVSPTTAGVPTITKPTFPNIPQEIGTVLVDDATTGSIQIIARSAMSYPTGYITEYDRDNTDNSTSGTGEDDLASTTIPANLLGTSSGLEIKAMGTITNVNNGDKTVNIHFGSWNDTMLVNVGGGQAWRVEIKIENITASSQRILWIAQIDGSTVNFSYQTASVDTTAEIIVKLTGECSDAADTITQKMWSVRVIK